METKTYTHRFLARVIIEAETPLAVGSGLKDITTDAMVALDCNSLPYIPGTSVAGVIRHAMDESHPQGKGKYTDQLFGFQATNDGAGSRIIFSDAKILGSGMKAVDVLLGEESADPFLKVYETLPIRQHVRIDHRGVAADQGKFDEQVVFAGTRFCFEIEMLSYGSDYQLFEDVLREIGKDSLRIGGGTRSGFGKVRVISIQTKTLDLTKEEDLLFYISKSSSLSTEFDGEMLDLDRSASGWTEYRLSLKPDDFFLFGSGYSDSEVDMTPVKESKVVWKDKTPQLETELILIPASSIKGAVSHRVAFFYNKAMGIHADQIQDLERSSRDNKAVIDLFGSAGTDDSMVPKRGNVLFSDIIESKPGSEDHILNHVAIDRFTGGAIAGALFSEKATFAAGATFETSILVKTGLDKDVMEAFECALKDICHGMLPLGGGVNRGNGIFTGSLTKNGESLC